MDLKYADITEKIIGCAMKVHGKMGAGYPEMIYGRCLAIEFDRIGLQYEKEKNLHVYYDEHIVGARRVDFMIEEKVVVELKAISELTNKELVQSLSYLESHHKEIALLLNFGAKSLQFKRLINNKNISAPVNPVHRINEPDTTYNAATPLNHPGHPSKNPTNPWS